MNLLRIKEIYYQINLEDIKSVQDGEYYQIILKDDTEFEFNNQELYELLGGKKW